jgi:hypothetical protein
MSKKRSVVGAATRFVLHESPLARDLREMRKHPPSLPRAHRPTPMSELSWPRRLRRVGGLLASASTVALAVSAATASSDWNVRSQDADPR